MNKCLLFGLVVLSGFGGLREAWARQNVAEDYPWRVGAASVEMLAEDSMVIGGGIGPGFTQGQEGKLQATATYIQGNGPQNEGAICIIAVDVLMMHRDTMDMAAIRVSDACGVPLERIMINASHTHHAPSTVTVHGYERDEEFCLRTVDAIVEAAILAQRKARAAEPSHGVFYRGQEETVGQNSRQKLDDGQIYWIGPRDNVVGPTDPFDPDFPVFAFRSAQRQLQAAWFNHSTHCIGTRTGRRSPSFYGLAAQELTEEHAMPVSFLSGAAGSTHNLTLDCDEMVHRIKAAFNVSLGQAAPMKSTQLAGIRREVPFTIRMFDDQVEDQKVMEYCTKYATAHADPIINVFRESRRQLKPQQGEERTMWLQVLQIGDVYLVGVPAEYFTVLGLEIKRRSPYPNTFVCGLSNDYVGYLPDRKGFQNGGYQTWMGLHCFAEVGTGELVVEQCLEMLNELAALPEKNETPAKQSNSEPPGQAQASVDADNQNFRAGAAAVEITPTQLPRIIAGGFLEGRGDQVQDPLFVRTVVMDDGRTQLAMAIVDTCMMPQDLLDEAKQLVAEACGLPTEHIMISATHTHSAPAAMGCLGTRLDADYAATLPPKIAESILMARSRLEPARIGWATIDDWQHTHNRRWVRHPDRMIVDPFGQATGRAHMHPGHESPDIIGPSGPVDPELSILSVQTRKGTPLAVIANYGQHYYGAPAISADYFGLFAKYVADLLGQPGDGNGPFVCAMSQGTSGDLATMDYGGPAQPRDMQRYAEGVARFAEQALQSIQYRDHAELAVVEKRLPLRYRVPDRERLAWARPIAAQIVNDVPKSLPEVYAREAIILHERQATEIKLQAIRVGDLTIATLPNEVYSLTGLKLKAQSPAKEHFNIELANGAEGYIPPPEQHVLGGYTTWPARTAGLAVDAEPKIVETLVAALEEVTGQTRRPMSDQHGMYARAVLAMKPTDYWRLNDADGQQARNAIADRATATLTPGFAWYLPGVGSGSGVGRETELQTSAFSGPLQINRAVHLADGQVETELNDLGTSFSITVWFWLGERSGARQRRGTLVTLPDGSRLVAEQFDDHQVELQYTEQHSERIYRANHWNFATLVRDGMETRVYVNGSLEPVIRHQVEQTPTNDATGKLIFGTQLLGKIDELAVWNRALTSDEIRRLWVLSEVPAELARHAIENERMLEQRRAQVNPPTFAPDYPQAIEKLGPQLYDSLQRGSESDPSIGHTSNVVAHGAVELTKQIFADFRGGRLATKNLALQHDYSMSVWFRCETRPETQPVAAYLLSIGPDHDRQASGAHLGIGGTHLPDSTGKLLFFNGNERNEVLVGRTVIPTATWNQVTVVRSGPRVQVYLNGWPSPEIDATIESTVAEPQPLFAGARSDSFAPLVGQLAHLAVFKRKLELGEVQSLFAAAGVAIEHVEQEPASKAAIATPEPDSQPRSPADSLVAIRVPAGYRVELVAAEPEVLDPVAFDWDEHGRLWVVEMADYPSGMDGAGKAGGRIRRLEDRDGDGRFETSQLFAEGLNFPNGILTWDQGVLVTAAPEILYLADTNHDGQADVREVWFSGFNEGNQQLRVNGLRWGLDGWVYCANGGHHAGHGTETQVSSVRTGDRLAVGSRDFRFHPITREMQVESGPSQFGRNRDAWGHWFGTQNANPLWQYVIPERYLQRNPYVPAPSPIRHVVGSGSPPVFPASPPEKRYHSYDQSGRFTSACGGMIYNDQWLFGPGTEAHGFTCEPFHNLVQHHVLSDAGPSYTSRRSRGEEQFDFFASEDRWCRPVMTRTGPDGALWIADMYRYMIEHPDWLTPEGRAELLPHYRLGEHQGRIYRVVREDAPRRPWPRLAGLSLVELVQALDSPNDWQRDKVQQLLAKSEPSAAIPAVKRLVETAIHPEARVQGLCLLQSWEAMSEASLVTAIRDPHPRVRENAIRVAEAFSNAAILNEVMRLANDSDAKVRFQVALSCGQWPEAMAGEALALIAEQDYRDPLVVAACMSSAVPHQDRFARRILSGDRLALAAFREPLLRHSLSSKNSQVIAWMLQDALRGSFGEQCRQLGDFVGAVQRLNLSLSQLRQEVPSSQLEERIAEAERVVQAARSQIETVGATTENQLPAAILLTRFVDDRQRAVTVLGQSLTPQVDGQLQDEVVRHLAASAAENVPEIFGQAWDGLSPTLRRQVLDAWLSRTEWTRALVGRIAAGEISANSLDLAQRTQLLQHRDAWVVEQANQLYRRELEPKQALIKYRESLALVGDVERGRSVYVTSCASCHRRGELGADVGPNLATVLGHAPEKLLANILDPNADIQPGYQSFACLLNTGEVLTGVLSAESAHSLTLTQANGSSRTILRSEIEQLSGTGVSLMPEGFEQTISPGAMADLLAFLKSPLPN